MNHVHESVPNETPQQTLYSRWYRAQWPDCETLIIMEPTLLCLDRPIQADANGRLRPDGRSRPDGWLRPHGRLRPEGRLRPDGLLRPDGRLRPVSGGGSTVVYRLAPPVWTNY